MIDHKFLSAATEINELFESDEELPEFGRIQDDVLYNLLAYYPRAFVYIVMRAYPEDVCRIAKDIISSMSWTSVEEANDYHTKRGNVMALMVTEGRRTLYTDSEFRGVREIDATYHRLLTRRRFEVFSG